MTQAYHIKVLVLDGVLQEVLEFLHTAAILCFVALQTVRALLKDRSPGEMAIELEP